MKKKAPIYVVSARYAGGLAISVTFSDGKERTIDFADFFARHPHPQHNRYARPENFRKFTLRDGNVIWGKNADMEFPVGALYAGNLELCCDEVAF